MTAGDLTVEMAAALTGVPVRAARHLVHGRGGRPLRRISPEMGRRLLRITTLDARRVGSRVVRAEATRDRLLALTASRGATELLAELGVTEDQARAVLDGTQVCPQLVALKVAAAYAVATAREDLVYRLPGRAA